MLLLGSGEEPVQPGPGAVVWQPARRSWLITTLQSQFSDSPNVPVFLIITQDCFMESFFLFGQFCMGCWSLTDDFFG